LSARNLRSSSGFPKDEIFVQRSAIAGPNNTVVTSDISLDLVDDRVIRILATEIFIDSLVIGAGSQVIAGVSLNPDKTTYAENLTDLGDDDIIHHVRWEKTLGLSTISIRRYHLWTAKTQVHVLQCAKSKWWILWTCGVLQVRHNQRRASPSNPKKKVVSGLCHIRSIFKSSISTLTSSLLILPCKHWISRCPFAHPSKYATYTRSRPYMTTRRMVSDGRYC